MTFEVKAILFDIDGTLVDSTDSIERAWRIWAADHNIPIDDLLAICHGQRTVDTVAHFLPAEQVETETNRVEVLEESDLEGVVALPEVSAILGSLPADRWAAVTSGTQSLMRARLQVAGLPIPEVLVAAEDVVEGKPHPEGFLKAAAALGVDPSECLVIEDAPAGVLAGVAAGAKVIAVTTSHDQEELLDAHAVVSGLSDLLIEVHSDGLTLTVPSQ